MEKWKCINSEIVLDDKYMKIRKDRLLLPNGKQKEWVYWDASDSSMVVGRTAEGKLVMIRQYRYLVKDEVIEFPAGSAEEGENPESCARREFKEESGYTCGKLTKLGSYYETYGQLNRQMHIYFADNVTRGQQKLDSGEHGFEDIEVMLVDLDEAVRMASDGRIAYFGAALAVLLLERKIREENKSKSH